MSSRHNKIQNPSPPPNTETVEVGIPYESDRRHQQALGPPWLTDEGWVISERRSPPDRRNNWH